MRSEPVIRLVLLAAACLAGCECDLSGPVPNDAGPQTDNQRCRSDNSIKCTADSDCPVTDNCVFYFGVALPLSSGNVPKIFLKL